MPGLSSDENYNDKVISSFEKQPFENHKVVIDEHEEEVLSSPLSFSKIFKELGIKKEFFDRNQKDFFEAPNADAEAIANFFLKRLYDDESKGKSALIDFIETRKALFGRKATSPAFLFTTLTAKKSNSSKHEKMCLVSISSVRQIPAEELALKKEKDKRIGDNVSGFWRAINELCKKLTQETGVIFILLGHKSERYNNMIASITNFFGKELDDREKEKECAEKKTHNFLIKLKESFSYQVDGSIPYSCTREEYKKITPCETCQKEIPAVQLLMERPSFSSVLSQKFFQVSPIQKGICPESFQKLEENFRLGN